MTSVAVSGLPRSASMRTNVTSYSTSKVTLLGPYLLLLLSLSGCAKEPEPQANPLPRDAFLSPAQAEATANACTALKPRLDSAPTEQSSFRQEFAPGVVLRVPKCIYTTVDFSRAVQPIKAKSVQMVFRFPDMTLDYEMQGTVEKYLQKQKGEYVPQKDRFPVFVIWMWHVKPDSDTFVPGSKQPDFGFEPRPPRMELNRHCFKLLDGKCPDQMIRIRSGLKGIDALLALKWSRDHPESLKHDFRKGGSYVARPESPYELLMDCGAINCQAHLYSKTWHFQLRMVFPSEGVEHADALFTAIDGMLGQWSKP